MILGIISIVYSFSLFASIICNQIEDFVKQGFISLAVFMAILAVMALIFAFASRLKGYRAGKSTSAIVMGFIALTFCIATIVKILV